MNNDSIILETEENINFMQALEYLAYGWIPYVDCDEILTKDNRAKVRGDGYFEQKEYRDKINQAAALLCNFIKNRKIKLYTNFIIPTQSNLHNTMNTSLVVYSDDYPENRIDDIHGSLNIIDNGKIISAQVKFMKKYRNHSQSDGSSLNEENNCYYIPICVIDYGFSEFLYEDCKGIIKFSELKACYEDEIPIENINKVIGDSTYTTPLIQIANAMIIRYGDKINTETRESVLNLASEQGKKLGYNDISQNERIAIFKVIRNPDTKKGGAKPHGATPEL